MRGEGGTSSLNTQISWVAKLAMGNFNGCNLKLSRFLFVSLFILNFEMMVNQSIKNVELVLSL